MWALPEATGCRQRLHPLCNVYGEHADSSTVFRVIPNNERMASLVFDTLLLEQPRICAATGGMRMPTAR